MKKQIITIAGKPGSGKSTTARLVSEFLGYTRRSSGDFMRKMAKERGVTIFEVNKLAERDDTIDKQVDDYVRSLGNESKIVVDSRLAFHWIPESFKVYLDLDLEVAAARIMRDKDEERFKTEKQVDDAEEYLAQMSERLESEKARYMHYYNVNPYDLNLYDMVIDTAEHIPSSVADLIVDSYHSWLA